MHVAAVSAIAAEPRRARPVGGRVSKAQGQGSKASGEETSDKKKADALSSLPEGQATTKPQTEAVVKTPEAGTAVVSGPVVKQPKLVQQ